MDSRDSRLAAAAAVQHALVTGVAAPDIGVSRRQLQRAADRGALERVYFDVYRTAGAPSTPHQRLLAACLAAGHDAVASHRAAAWLWAFDGFLRPGPVELTVAARRRPALGDVVVHRTQRFDPVDRAVRDGVPVTTRERTLVDLGAVVRPYLVRNAVESYLRTGGSEARLRARMEAVAGRGCRGVGVLRAVLDQRADRVRPSGSPIELDFLDLCRRHGLEDPVPQYPVELFDGSRCVVDWAWPQHRALVELQGFEAHGERRADFERDADRRLILKSMGYRYLDFTGRQLENEWLVMHALRTDVPELWCSDDG